MPVALIEKITLKGQNMRMKHTRMRSMAPVLVLAGTLSASWSATADPVTGFYVGGGGGVNFMQEEPVTNLGSVSTGSLNLNMGVGAVGVGSVGYGFGNGFRMELEGAYRYNGVQSFTGGPHGGTVSVPSSSSGKEQKYGPMVNGFYDFNGVSPVFVPYVGVGVGYQFVNEAVNIPAVAGGGGVSVNKTEGAFAIQAILGAAFPIAAVPGLSFTTEYRFMAVTGDRQYPAGAGSITLGDNFNHSLIVGVRYEFGVAPPAPAPMPVADMGAKTFLVFFDWDKYDLTARGQGIVQDAAAYSTHSQYTRIDVDGNTDTSGTANYNMGLSERRARTVASELVRDGVPQNAISMHAYGDTKLLVPTGPGVREPQNRRVEIVFH
jgi:OmpA-OmpF porin, OOP family